jgi:hypothetical protein
VLCTFIKPLSFKSDSSVTKELDPAHYETKLFHKDIFLHSDTNDPFHSQVEMYSETRQENKKMVGDPTRVLSHSLTVQILRATLIAAFACFDIWQKICMLGALFTVCGCTASDNCLL